MSVKCRKNVTSFFPPNWLRDGCVCKERRKRNINYESIIVQLPSHTGDRAYNLSMCPNCEFNRDLLILPLACRLRSISLLLLPFLHMLFHSGTKNLLRIILKNISSRRIFLFVVYLNSNLFMEQKHLFVLFLVWMWRKSVDLSDIVVRW